MASDADRAHPPPPQTHSGVYYGQVHGDPSGGLRAAHADRGALGPVRLFTLLGQGCLNLYAGQCCGCPYDWLPQWTPRVAMRGNLTRSANQVVHLHWQYFMEYFSTTCLLVFKQIERTRTGNTCKKAQEVLVQYKHYDNVNLTRSAMHRGNLI